MGVGNPGMSSGCMTALFILAVVGCGATLYGLYHLFMWCFEHVRVV